MSRLLRVNIEGLQTRILKSSVKTLRYAHLLRLLSQKVLNPLHTVERVAKFFPLADLIKFLLLTLLNQVEQGQFGSLAASGSFLFAGLGKGHDGEVLGDNRIGLLSPGSFVGDGVEGPFDLVDGHAVGVGVIDADPPEAHSLQLFLQLGVHTKLLPILKMHQRTPNLSTIIMLPQVLAQTFEGLLNAIKGGPDRQDDYFPLAGIFVNRQHYLLPIVSILKHSYLLVLEHFHSREEGLFELTFAEGTCQVLAEFPVLYLQLLPGHNQS